MKYTKEQRIDIGRQIFNQEISRADTQERYSVAGSCIDRYIHEYKIANGIPTQQRIDRPDSPLLMQRDRLPLDIEVYKAMSKDELINELIKAKVNETRAKKGYEVKGVGAGKEFISLNDRNSKS